MNIQARFAKDLAEFGERIKGLRVKKKLTQPMLSDLTGMRISNISRIEHGRSNLKLFTIIKFAEAFKLNIASLFTNDAFSKKYAGKYNSIEERLENEKKKLGLRIEKLTSHRRLKQDELAILSKIDAGDISRYISGESNIEFINIVKIAVALEVKIFDLFDYNGALPDNKGFKGRL